LITRAGAIGLSSFLAGVASVILAYWFLGFLALVYILLHFGPPTGQTWRSFVFGLAEPLPVAIMTVWIGAAGLAGGAGYGASLWARREGAGRLATSATRFAVAGLAGAGLDVMVLALMAAYFWLV
jgi:hypothetical protein